MGCQDEEWSFPGFHIVSQNDPQDEKTVSSIKHKSEIEYTVSPDDEEVQCPECGTECGMYGNRNPRRVQDLSKPDGARVYLTIESKRYNCSACKKTRSHPAVHALVRGRSPLTNRLANRIKEESLLYTPEILESDYGISKRTINKLTDEYLRERESDWVYYTPERLGLFSLLVGKHYRLLFFDLDLTNYGIVDFLESAKEEKLRPYLESKNDLNAVRTAIIAPMPYHRKMIREFCPNAKIIVDISAVKNALDYATKKELSRFSKLNDYEKIEEAMLKSPLQCEKRCVEEACRNEPSFNELCDRKKQLDELYQNIKDHECKRIDRWITNVAGRFYLNVDFRYFSEFVGMIFSFEKEIKNSTECRYQTDFAQQTMNLASTLQKCGAGYQFNNLRARVLFAPRKRIKQEGTGSIRSTPSGRYVAMHKTAIADLIGSWNVKTIGNYVSLEDVIVTQLLAAKGMNEGIHTISEEDKKWIEAYVGDVVSPAYELNNPNWNNNNIR